MDIEKIQKAIDDAGLSGWLFYDFHQRDPISQRILGLDPEHIVTRRWYYYVPAHGEPKKLCHSMEPAILDHLPGSKVIYLRWQELRSGVKDMLEGARKIAMQFSEYNMIPYVSVVDAGTADYIRSLGVEIESSAELIGIFESSFTTEELETHKEAYRTVLDAKDFGFKQIADYLKKGENPTEFQIHKEISQFLEDNDMTWDMGPIVSINEHNADPHFMPTGTNSMDIREGDLILFDIWAKKKAKGSIYADVTWMGFAGTEVPQKHEELFRITCDARDAAVDLIRERFRKNIAIEGWEVDNAARGVIEEAGYGKDFFHRTGHNIGEEVHGPGVHMDNLETRDERKLIPGICFSIEPGIYLPEQKAGYRTEIDVYITHERNVEIAGQVQQNIIPILNL